MCIPDADGTDAQVEILAAFSPQLMEKYQV
jgi:hypothetical protein